MSWDSYHYAPDGSWVSRDRECVRHDGEPKRAFETLADAERVAVAISSPPGGRGRRYHAYVRSSGHYLGSTMT